MNSTDFFLGDSKKRNIRNFYEISKKELGKGSYGRVFQGNLIGTNLKRAIKIIDKSKVSNFIRFKLEVEIMMRLDHPNILRLIDYYEDKSNVYLVLELCTGGELFDRIIAKQYYDEDEGRILFKQIIKALNYCHRNGVCHRDLKPENFIMISEDDPYTLKIIDFGLGRTFQNDGILKEKDKNEKVKTKRRKTKAVLKTKAGTPFYIAPEVLTGNYNEKCDVWSAGVVLYILLCGYPPFYGESNQEILRAVKAGKLDFSSIEWKDKSKDVINLVRKMISHHVKRPFTEEVLSDKWININKNSNIEKEKVKILCYNIQKYSNLDIFRKIVLYFEVRNLTEEDISHYHSYFDLFDDSNKGEIDLKSFSKIIKKYYDLEDNEIEKIFTNIDIFSQKTISYSQFLSAVIPYTKFFNKKRLVIFFKLCDIDQNKKISEEDLKIFLDIQFRHMKNNMDLLTDKVIDSFNQIFKKEVKFDQFLKELSNF